MEKINYKRLLEAEKEISLAHAKFENLMRQYIHENSEFKLGDVLILKKGDEILYAIVERANIERWNSILGGFRYGEFVYQCYALDNTMKKELDKKGHLEFISDNLRPLTFYISSRYELIKKYKYSVDFIDDKVDL